MLSCPAYAEDALQGMMQRSTYGACESSHTERENDFSFGSHDGDDELSDGSAGPNDDAAVAAAEMDADSTDVEDLSGEFDDADESMCVI